MATTRGTVIDRVANMLGDTSTDFRTFMETSFNNMLYALHDLHDWEWKHKSGTFPTVASTESYVVATAASLTDFRSPNDIEVLWDSTNKRFLNRKELRDIRKRYPEGVTTGQPTVFAGWGDTTVYFFPIPDGAYTIKFLYTKTATEATSDANTLVTTLGVPAYVHYLFEKMCLAEGMLYHDDARRTALLEEIIKVWKPLAMQADMKHLESGARFKFWEEEVCPSGVTYDDYLRKWWAEA